MDGANAITSTEINGEIYFFVASFRDSGVQVLRLENDGFVPVFSITDAAELGLYGAIDLAVADVAGEKYLYVVGNYDNALTSFRIDIDGVGTDGNLVLLETVRDGNLGGQVLNLAGARSIEVTTIGTKTFVVATSNTDDAVSVLRVGNDGKLTLVDSVVDTEGPNLNLNGADSVEIVQIGKKTFAYVGSDTSDNGLSAFSMSATGKLSSIQNIDHTGYSDIGSLSSMTSNGKTFLFAADKYSQRIFVYQIAANGQLTEQSVFDYNHQTVGTSYSSLQKIDSFVVDGVGFVTATDYSGDAIAVYGLSDDGSLTQVSDLRDSTALNGMAGIEMFRIGDRVLVMGTAYDGDRAVLAEIGASDDALVGTSASDKIVGLAGGDDLIGRAGNDALFGGSGEDVLSGRSGNDALYGGKDDDVLVGDLGNDLAEGGKGADILSGGAGKDTLSYASSSKGVTVNLQDGTASGGDAEGDRFVGFENLKGSRFGDALTGDEQANILTGANGNDAVFGGNGNDRVYGGAGNDELGGGSSKDFVFGGGGSDEISGDGGNDVLRGGSGNDHVFGGDGADKMKGDAGNDTLDGGAGDDGLSGGGGKDTFVFGDGFGSDQIDDFDLAQDRLDFRTNTEINSLSDFNAAAISFTGNTLVSLADGSTLVIADVLEAQFTDQNFLF